MNLKDIRSIDDSKLFDVLKPVKRQKKHKVNPCIIGFDTEFQTVGDEQEIISIQLANYAQSVVYTDFFDAIKLICGGDLKTITQHQLLWKIEDFLKQSGYVEIPDEIYLISHFAQAEISNLDSLENIDLFQTARGLSGKYELEYYNLDSDRNVKSQKVRIHIKDLFNIFNCSLEKVGDYLQIPKVSLQWVGSRDENYWKSHMKDLLKSYPSDFEDYAKTDAEICYRAYVHLREFFLKEYDTDILNFNTLPSIAGYIFRKDYLREPVAPTKRISVGVNQPYTLVGGIKKYSKTTTKEEIYAGDSNVRLSSLWSYHGARVESFVRGRIEGAGLAYYDVSSLYPSSAMLQPLPCKDTKWYDLSPLDEESLYWFLKKGEGFIEVKFNFPEGTLYPNLPVASARDNILYFPIDGVSHCTISELRMAIKLGLWDYEILSGFVFMPKDREINHPLKSYMEDMLAKKSASNKGGIDYELFKMLMNSIIGKFIEKYGDNPTLNLIREGYLQREVYHKVTRKVSSHKRVGNLWSPEWASLILGKARSIISEFCAKGSHMVSTDSVLLHKETDIYCDSLEELRSVGSDLVKEFDVTHGVFIRSRLYALNPTSHNPDEIHIARHSVHSTPDEFLRIIIEGYETKQPPDLEYKRERFIKYHEYLRKGLRLHSTYLYESEIKLDYDGKRLLDNEVSNPFSEFSFSKPITYTDVQSNRQRKVTPLKRGRKSGKRLTESKRIEISEMFEKGFKQVDIVKELGVSKGWVSKVIGEFKSNEKLNLKEAV